MSNKIRNIAIIIMSLGEPVATEILKKMTSSEIKAIEQEIKKIDEVSESEIREAASWFMNEVTGNNSYDPDSLAKNKNLILDDLSKKNFVFNQDYEFDNWPEVIKNYPEERIVDLMKGEHPQVATAMIVLFFNHVGSEYGLRIISRLHKEMQNEIIRRMTKLNQMPQVAYEYIMKMLKDEFKNPEMNGNISLDGVEILATIISSFDTEVEHKIVNMLTSKNKVLGEQIQDRIFPFERIAELDRKSLQILLAEVKNEDLMLALKGVSDNVKEVFFSNMSAKSAEILKDDMQSMGPTKMANVKDAQKRIIKIAKKLEADEKIILSSKDNPNIVY